MLSILVLIYFAIIQFHKRFYHKETLVAIVYTAGVLLGPYSCAETVAPSLLLSCFFNIAALAFLNLMIFSEFEKETDLKSGYPSLALALGSKSGPMIIWILILQLISLSVIAFAGLITVEAASCFALMNLLLCFIYFGKSFSKRREYYRILGDGIFFIPALFLL